MANAYRQTVHLRIFVEGQLVLRVAKHVRKNIPGPSKFAPKWEKTSDSTHEKGRLANLERLEEKQEVSRKGSQRYQ